MRALRIVACVKHVLDPEIPPGSFRLADDGIRPRTEGLPFVMDSYAANALETGLQLRDRVTGAGLTVLCVGDEGADEMLRHTYAVTADEAVRVWDDAWADLDGLATAHVLARAVEAMGGADLILCGREAGDVEEGLVPPALAEELGAVCVTLAERVEVDGSRARAVQVVKRDAHGVLTLEASLPAVVSVTSTADNVLRMPTVRDRMMSRRKSIRTLTPGDLALDEVGSLPRSRVVRLTIPEARGACTLIEGGDGAEQAANLVSKLQELKIL